MRWHTFREYVSQWTLRSLYWLQYWFYITVYSGWLSPSHQRLIIYWILIVTGAEFFFLFFVKLYPRTQFSLLCVCTVCSYSRSSWQKSGSVVLGWKLHIRNTSVCVLLNCVCFGGFGRLSSRFVPTCFCFLAGLLCVGCFCDGIKPNHNAEVLFIHECCMCKCYFISVRRINWVWLARKAHQPTRESKEVTKMKWKKRQKDAVESFSIFFSCLTSILQSPTITRQQQSNQAWRQIMTGTLKRLCSRGIWVWHFNFCDLLLCFCVWMYFASA